MIPNRTKAELLRGNIDLSAVTLRVALLRETTEYTPDPATHAFVADVLDAGTTGEEFTDTNYARQTLANTTVTQDDTDAEGVLDADDITWSSLGGTETIEAVLVYQQVGADDTTPADDPIIRVLDDSVLADLPLPTSGDDVILTWDVEGVVYI